MKFAIVYDSLKKPLSKTRNTKRAAEEMARIVEAAGHTVYLAPVQDAEVEIVRACDVICIGSWTQGLFFILQSATEATLNFLRRLDPIANKRACVFCTYKTSYGKMLLKMADTLRRSGGIVNAFFGSRGGFAAPEFASWVASLGNAEGGNRVEAGAVASVDA